MDKVINWFCLTAAIFSISLVPLLTLLEIRDTLKNIDKKLVMLVVDIKLMKEKDE